jgi:hypothetical protein
VQVIEKKILVRANNYLPLRELFSNMDLIKYRTSPCYASPLPKFDGTETDPVKVPYGKQATGEGNKRGEVPY